MRNTKKTIPENDRIVRVDGANTGESVNNSSAEASDNHIERFSYDDIIKLSYSLRRMHDKIDFSQLQEAMPQHAKWFLTAIEFALIDYYRYNEINTKKAKSSIKFIQEIFYYSFFNNDNEIHKFIQTPLKRIEIDSEIGIFDSFDTIRRNYDLLTNLLSISREIFSLLVDLEIYAEIRENLLYDNYVTRLGDGVTVNESQFGNDGLGELHGAPSGGNTALNQPESLLIDKSKALDESLAAAIAELRDLAHPLPVIKTTYRGIRVDGDPFKYLEQHFGEAIRYGTFEPGDLNAADSKLYYSVRERALAGNPALKIEEYFETLKPAHKKGSPIERKIASLSKITGLSPEEVVDFIGDFRPSRVKQLLSGRYFIENQRER